MTSLSVANRLRRLKKDERGQGMTEYIIIIALVAVATIGVVTLFGDNIRNLFATSADALAGDTDAKAKTKRNNLKLEKDLKKFGEDNKP